MNAHLLAAAIDQLVTANWQRSEDGQKGRRKPKPIPRPGIQDESTAKLGGNKTMSLTEAEIWLKKRMGAVPENTR
jgi:hypothetical protein